MNIQYFWDKMQKSVIDFLARKLMEIICEELYNLWEGSQCWTKLDSICGHLIMHTVIKLTFDHSIAYCDHTVTSHIKTDTKHPSYACQ